MFVLKYIGEDLNLLQGLGSRHNHFAVAVVKDDSDNGMETWVVFVRLLFVRLGAIG